MEVIVFLLCFVTILFMLFLWDKKKDRLREKQLEKTISTKYGERRKKNFSPYEMEQISYYGKNRKESTYVDELTWDNLTMDLIFERSCYCKSGIGEEYYYYMLRNPVRDWKELNSLEKKIRCFMEREKAIKLQMKLTRLGKMKKYSMARYFDFLWKCERGKNKAHYLALAALVSAFCLMYFYFFPGLCIFFFLILYQIISYFKVKARLDPYLQSIRYLLQMVTCVHSILPLLPKEWQEEKLKMQEILLEFKKETKFSSFILSGGTMAGQGLELILDYARMIFHFDLIIFNKITDYIIEKKEELEFLFRTLGKLDSCMGIAEFRNTLEIWSNPKQREEKGICITKGIHPLLEDPVANSLSSEKSILFTGSNASGKSTFLKMIGVNLLMGQGINTCAAEEFSFPTARLFTCLSAKDSLLKKESYYMAEIRSIKAILEYKKSEQNPTGAFAEETLICLLDEVLKGTNTMERIAASTEILSYMNSKNIYVLAATHDLELTKTLEQEYEQYHFEETIQGNDMKFSFLLLPGSANSTNAIELLSVIGYEKEIVAKARKRIEKFCRKGEWT